MGPSVLLRGERDVRRADPYARLYSKTWSNTGRVKTSIDRYVEGKTLEYSREQAWLDDRRTISNRARQRDNPGMLAIVRERCKQSPDGKAKG